MSNTVYFATSLDASSGELTLRKVEAPVEDKPAHLIVVDPTNADPTLTRFYEVDNDEPTDHTAAV